MIVRPDVYQQYRGALRVGKLVAVAGLLQKAYGTTNVVARRAFALDLRVPAVVARERAPLAAVLARLSLRN